MDRRENVPVSNNGLTSRLHDSVLLALEVIPSAAESPQLGCGNASIGFLSLYDRTPSNFYSGILEYCLYSPMSRDLFRARYQMLSTFTSLV